jgi:hypothetical protein
MQVGLQVLRPFLRFAFEAKRILHRIDRAVLGRGDGELAFGVAQRDPRCLGGREEPFLVFVSAEPANDLAIGVIERVIGALKRGVGAFVEPELRLIGAIHAEGGGGGDRKKDRGR